MNRRLPPFLLCLAVSAGAQNPASVPGLRLWLDAQDAPTVIESGGKVFQWSDKSGNNSHATQGDANRQPVRNAAAINGRAAIRFDGFTASNSTDPNDDGLYLTNDPGRTDVTLLNLVRPYTVFIVDQYWDNSVRGRTLQSQDTNWIAGKWGANTVHFTGAFVGANLPAPALQATTVMGWGGPTDNGRAVNGVPSGRNTANYNNPGRMALGTPTLFNQANGYREPAKSDVGEVLAWNRTLADPEIRVVENYLSNRWGTPRPHQRRFGTEVIRFTGGDAGEGLDFSGDFLAAVDVGGGGGVAIGDALFTDDTGYVTQWQNHAPAWGVSNFGPSVNDQNLSLVLNSIRWHNGSVGAENPANVRAVVNGLIPGHAYQVQVINWEACCPNRHYGVQINGEVVKQNVQASTQGAAGAGAGVAVIHRFIATGTQLTLQLRSPSTGGGDINPILAAFTVEDLGVLGFSTAAPVTGPGSLDLDGTFVHALNFAGTGDAVVNGVTFRPAETATNAFTLAENSIPNFYRPDFGADPDAEALEGILESIRWEATGSEEESLAVDLRGLTPGSQYKLQLLFADLPTQTLERKFDIVVNQVEVADAFHPVGVTGRAANQGAVFTHIFLAGSTEMNLVLDGRGGLGVANRDPNPILSALTLEDIGPTPIIVTQPEGGSVLPGGSFTLRTGAIGAGMLSYQWRLDGENLAGATGSELELYPADEPDVGDYTCVVSGAGGSVTSLVARVELTALPPVATGGVFLNELLAANDGGLRDEDGETPDWIELRNDNPFPVNLAGWRLTDNPGDTARWTFPATVVPAHGFVVVFASDKDRRIPGRTLHTNFRLTTDGEYLALVSPAGVVMDAHAPAFPPQRDDLSYGDAIRTRVTSLTGAATNTAARFRVPADGTPGLDWTGGSEPFDDSGWTAALPPLGYDTLGAFVEPPVQEAGHDLINRGTVDGANGGAFVQTSAPFTEPGTVTRWRMFAGIAGRQITPLIFVQTNGSFVITGIGATRTSAVGLQTNDFALVSGSAEVGPGHFVGWKDGAQGVNNPGVISWNLTGAGSMQYFNTRTTFAVGENLGAGAFYERQYSVQFAVMRRLGDYVETDVGAALNGVNPSLLVRMPFSLASVPAADTLRLRVRAEDGFVAWLNGTEIARANAPAGVEWNSASATDLPVTDGVAEQVIDVTAHLGLLRAGLNVLALQGLNEAVTSPEFLLGAALESSLTSVLPDRFMVEFTPGAPNADGYVGLVSDTGFTPRRGLYDTAQQVAITNATPGSAIYYTTDGSEPSPENGVLYAGPIPVAATTLLRARAYKDDHLPTNVDTHTYVFPLLVADQPAAPAGLPATWATIAGDYQMDPDVRDTTLPGYSVPESLRALPTLSLVMPHTDWWGASDGIYVNSSSAGPAWERKVSLEFFTADGTERWQEDAGVEINGNSSRGHGFTPKHSFRVTFRDEYGPKQLRRALYPDGVVQEFDMLTLRGCSTDSLPVMFGPVDNGVQRWNPTKGTYLRDQWVRDTLRDLGQDGARGRYVHLYLNGLYWGVYNVAERLNSGWNALRYGGDKDEYDVIKDFAEVESGNIAAWNQLMALADAGFATETAYQAVQGNHPDGTRNPDLPVLLDVGNLIDYMIVHIYSGAEDWPTHNFWASRRRGPQSEGFRFYAWDQEISNDSLVRVRVGSHVGGDRFELVDDRGGGAPSHLYAKLRANPSFQQRFRDRVQELVLNPGGGLTPAVNSTRWQVRQQEIDLAMVAESARWGDYRFATPAKRETTWLAEMDWMANTYWPQIHPIATARFLGAGLLPVLAPPAFAQDGGAYPDGFTLAISHTNATGVIWYSLDGADPRASSAAPAASARAYTGPLALSNLTVRVTARVRNGSDWSAPVQALFVPADTDGDGLPDWWETANGTQVAVPDASVDTDGDGHTNAQEYRTGTHAGQAASLLRAEAALPASGHTVAWSSVPGKVYTVEWAPSPAGPWSELATVPAAGIPASVTTVLDPDAGVQSRRCYRVRVDP